jgi:hypothetical protein
MTKFEEEANSMIHYQERQELFQEMFEEYHLLMEIEFGNATIMEKGDVEDDR